MKLPLSFLVKRSIPLLSFIISGAQASSLTLAEAVDFWELNERQFNSFHSCSMNTKKIGFQKIITIDSEKCTISEVASYILAKECNSKHHTIQASIRDNDSREIMDFSINNKNCRLLSSSHQAEKIARVQQSSKTHNENQQHYVIQFYSGHTPPKEDKQKCQLKLPKYVHHIKGKYYLFSRVFHQFSSARETINTLKTTCPYTDAWLRPVLSK